MQHKSLFAKLACGWLIAMLLCFSNFFGFDLKVDQAKAETSPSYNSSRIIFTLSSITDLLGIVQTFSLSNLTTIHLDLNLSTLNLSLSYLATVPAGQDSLQVANLMNRDSRVQMAEPDYNVSYMESGMSFKFDSDSMINPSAATSAASNQWAWSKTNLSKAKSVSQGNNVTVAILDTGVNYKLPQFNGKATSGYNVFDGTDGSDVNGHGTFVAGIVNQVAPQAKIVPVRVLDAGGNGSMSGVIDGVNYAVMSGARIINMSFTTPTYSKVLEKLIKTLSGKDILVVAAAGNDNSSTTYYPAGFQGVLAVGGTNPDDDKATFSNYGTYLGLGAPSTTIYSYWWKGGYAWGDGTSFAAPITGGAAALYRSLHFWATARTTTLALQGAVDAYPTSCSACATNSMGSGRLNLGRVVTAS